MGSFQIFINAVVVALMAMYVYENERKMEKMSIKNDLTGKEIDVLKKVVISKEDHIKELKQLLSTKAETEKLTEIIHNLTELENQQISGKRNLTEVEIQLNVVTRKLDELEKQLLMSNEKGVTYIRWGKAKCDGPSTKTIYSGQVGGGHHTHPGASVNYICLSNNPDVAQPLKSDVAYLYGAEYQLFDHNKPNGIKSGIGDHDVACAACLAKGKISSIMIPGRKTCYNGWTKEYEGILMAGHHGHTAASEYACLDKDTEVIAGGSKNDDGKLFYPVKTQCGSLKCPPYTAGTEVLCAVCSK